MPGKYRFSLTVLSTAALLSAFASSVAQSQPPKGYIGRNDGRVQPNAAPPGFKAPSQQRKNSTYFNPKEITIDKPVPWQKSK